MKAPKRSSRDLLALLMAHHREKQLAPLREAQKSLAAILDGLNAFGALDDLRRTRLSPTLSAGPAVRDGIKPHAWVGVLIWHRPSGYLGYKTLTLIGVWGMAQDDQQVIAVGVKRLSFAAPFYDAEAYVKIIRTSFDLYYQDDGSPPNAPARTLIYDAARRLEIRQEIAAALNMLVIT